MNAPQTLEGWQVWDLVLRLEGQLRVAPSAVLGFDMTAALAMGRALGIRSRAVAELLPAIEAQMVRQINEQIKAGTAHE